MGTTASTGRAAKPLAVLAVLLGLLAMHVLSSTHHAVAAAPAPHAALPATAPASAPDVEAAAHHHAVALPPALHDTVGFVGGPDAPCGDGCPELAMLCVDADQAARLLREAADGRDLRPVALHAALRSQGWQAMLTQFAADGFHPNDRGHRVWADAFWREMSSDVARL